MPLWKNIMKDIAVEHFSCSNVAFKIQAGSKKNTEDEPFLKLHTSSLAPIILRAWLCLHTGNYVYTLDGFY